MTRMCGNGFCLTLPVNWRHPCRVGTHFMVGVYSRLKFLWCAVGGGWVQCLDDIQWYLEKREEEVLVLPIDVLYIAPQLLPP